MTEKSTLRRATRRLPVLRAEIDDFYRVEKIERDTATTVACKKGCAHCCHQMVTISMSEALDLYLAVVDKPWLREKIHQWSSAQSLLVMRGMTADQWFKSSTRCMFLTDNNDCAVYEKRPFACRGLLALDTADNCKLGADELVVKRPDHTPAFVYTLPTTTKMAEELGLPVGLIPLPVAMQWARIAWTEGRKSLRLAIEKAGIPAYDFKAHLLFWVARVEDAAEMVEVPPVP